MSWILIFVLSLSFIAFNQQTPQLRPHGERQAGSLPEDLSESETQTILRERNPKSHVDATLKVSDSRLASALRFAEEDQYQSAAQDVDLYAALIIYADAYTRKLPDSQMKDRNVCLKKIEQAIFKRSRTVDATLRQLPLHYRETVEPKIDMVKKIRLRAINDLLGGGAVIDTSFE